MERHYEDHDHASFGTALHGTLITDTVMHPSLLLNNIIIKELKSRKTNCYNVNMYFIYSLDVMQYLMLREML